MIDVVKTPLVTVWGMDCESTKLEEGDHRLVQCVCMCVCVPR